MSRAALDNANVDKISSATLDKGLIDISIENCNWLVRPEEGKTYSARTRYRQTLLPCVVAINGAEAKVTFLASTEPAAPGQSLVVYDGEVCIGGGIID